MSPAAVPVKVVITGKHECKSVVIDPSVVDPEDVEMLQDLIQLAFNSAQTRSLRNLRGAHAQGSSASSGYEAAVLISLTRSER